ncbi:hypothetical protein JP75_24600 [Devosia riboflavina]|uniref:Uncharacterized protein n=1 Tax=Devosia riboflavina TaxID=46914 RepID=A0A087LUY9_9HYPH|nr:hypothetical protein [Devosia riboflavina]KFL28442.1 hypothetical protein JP75_24600 [Devosia riboflavina]
MTNGFDYSAAAELFPSRGYRGSVTVGYRRFGNAAEAVRFAIEDMPSTLLKGAMLEVNEQRFNGGEILELYQAESYPLGRPEAAL